MHLEILGEVTNLEHLELDFINEDPVAQEAMQEAIWNSTTGLGDEPPHNPGVVDGKWADLVGPCPPLPDSQVEDNFFSDSHSSSDEERKSRSSDKNDMIQLVKRGKKHIGI